MKRREEEQREATETEEQKGEEGDAAPGEVSAEIETPVVFVPQDLPETTIEIDIPPSISRGIDPLSVLRDVESSSETFVNIPATILSSPTLSISTVSDLTPTELGEEIEHSEDRRTTHHDTFYFKDGNIEIACGDTVFRVHSTVVSFSSPKLRDIFSPPTLLDAPVPEGCPRIVLTDSPGDFSVLLKTIYTPGYVPPPPLLVS